MDELDALGDRRGRLPARVAGDAVAGRGEFPRDPVADEARVADDEDPMNRLAPDRDNASVDVDRVLSRTVSRTN
ncbi:hypothetical protein [Saliphagus infecundisoli]|uniref:Uncharacterized protein n=1 Tax=Saliphagus infecundisoli TaxID=1849069 RepID=A0ABD5QJ66_9EURY|nr:hypothetical protein [Saliphagus infecundisoli]